MTARKATAAKSTPKPADPNRCVVGDCRNRQVPGSKVCSAHTMHYHRDGSRRDGKGRDV